MNIAITTSTPSDEQAFRLLELIGIPFTKGRA
jgi:large subunit ribosomal protein L5